METGASKEDLSLLEAERQAQVEEEAFNAMRDPRVAVGQRVMNAVVSEMSEITPNVFLSGQGPAEHKQMLKDLGITHIVNVGGGDCPNLFPRDFRYHTITVEDAPSSLISRFFEDSSQFINQAVMQGGRVLVHCTFGISRSPTIVMAYLIKFLEMSRRDAEAHVRDVRPMINPNPSFLKQLEELEHQLRPPEERVSTKRKKKVGSLRFKAPAAKKTDTKQERPKAKFPWSARDYSEGGWDKFC
eukprot:gnl/Spiro4/24340_TR12094_c0_g2_i1.p1 gnl/Spiro4/24340_TR12094_c0_g2~~gnl/Spiro4/24340_TR12094_c0_g2_i1.p1  ORF type:complete len:258 (-),score=53.43 gnl/Spiro4/24340_TR12094_c0_g2_i1:131-859(-)